MAVTTSRLVGAVLAMAVVGVAGGYGAGTYTQSDLPVPTGQARPLSDVTPPMPSPPPKKKTPKPNNTKPLDPGKIEYREQSFVAKGAVDSKVTAEMPRGWTETFPNDSQARYTDQLGERWVRLESGMELLDPPAESMRKHTVRLASVEAEDNLVMLARTSGTLKHRDGTVLTISTMVYTYIPEDTLRYVLVRWVGLGSPSLTAVVISVTGLPQDKKALETILDHATETVRRKD